MTAESSPERLRRLELLFARSPIYFVTACTSRRRKILATAPIHQSLIRFAKEGPEHGAWIGAYVLMPDHLHLFISFDDERLALTTWMKSLKNAVSQTLRSQRIAMPHFQKGFFDHVLRSAESYEEKWHYVRENPVRAGLAKRWDEWPFCGEIFALEYRANN
jgi:REP element-mobilizing transposase RayT